MYALALTVNVIFISTSALRIQPDAASAPRKGQSAVIWSKSVEWARSNGIHSEKLDACQYNIHKPSTEEYNLGRPTTEWYSQVGQDEKIAKLLTGETGFFIESGGADGEHNSNTLHFEKKGWLGLLVEPSPGSFPVLLSKHRKAFAYNGALSTTGKTGKMYLQMRDCGLEERQTGTKCRDCECSTMVDGPGENVTEIEVAPLPDLLACLGQKTVDFWSLDVEGMESQILQGFPFQKIEVGVMLIEMNKGEENNKAIAETLTSHGFNECTKAHNDRIYVNPSYFAKRHLKLDCDQLGPILSHVEFKKNPKSWF